MPTTDIQVSHPREHAPPNRCVQDRFQLHPTQFRFTSAFRFIIYAGEA